MKILHICKQLDGGGVERVIYNYINGWEDKRDTFFIVKHVSKEGMLEKPLREKNCRIIYVVPKSKNPAAYIKNFCRVVKENNIDVVHCHQGYMSFFPLLLAKFCGVKKRIAHGHTAYEKETGKRRRYRGFCTALTRYAATDLCACTESAGNWMWKKNFTVFPNILQIEDYYFNAETRREVRSELLSTSGDLSRAFVAGCVSRLAPGKNHDFLLDIFACIKEKEPSAVLVIAGDGSLRKQIEEKIKRLRLEKSVLLLGNRSDAARLLNAFDAFVLPTEYEGLGISLVEAQINGLPVYTSKDAVPAEAEITGNYHTISLNAAAEEWAEKILSGSRARLSEKEKEKLDDYRALRQVRRLRNLYVK